MRAMPAPPGPHVAQGRPARPRRTRAACLGILLLVGATLVIACGAPREPGADELALRELQAEWSNSLAVLHAARIPRAELEADAPPAGYDAGQRAGWARCRTLYLRAVEIHPVLAASGRLGPDVGWPLP